MIEIFRHGKELETCGGFVQAIPELMLGSVGEQDSRWGDAEKKLLRRTKFSKVLEQKVNMKKVNMDVMQRWITQRITSLLGFEDDIVVGTCVNYLSEEGNLDPKKLQLQLTGFLEKSTGMFMEELWRLLVDAQNSIGGIPSAFLQDKKDEILQAKEQERKREEELRQDCAAYQKIGSVTTSTRDEVAIEPEVNKFPETITLPKPSEGRRASRWGISAAVIAQTNPLATSGDGIDDIGTPEGPTPSTFPRVAADRSADGDSSEFPRVIDGHQKERDDSDEKSRKHYRGRRDRDEAIASAKEKKRKSKSKHGKKSSRKKSKRERRSGEDREQDGRSGREYVSQTREDEGSSSENEAKSVNDVEETLRLKVIASVASRKSRPGEGES